MQKLKQFQYPTDKAVKHPNGKFYCASCAVIICVLLIIPLSPASNRKIKSPEILIMKINIWVYIGEHGDVLIFFMCLLKFCIKYFCFSYLALADIC